MDEARLPAHLEIAGLVRAAQAKGGFATVLAKGERDAGTIMVVCCHAGGTPRAYERMPQRDGTRAWALARAGDPDDPFAFADFCERRRRQDSDLWIIELDLPNAERLIGLAAPQP